jgi:protein-S-isoprenylcysteine O-methyltransferase Ste14
VIKRIQSIVRVFLALLVMFGLIPWICILLNNLLDLPVFDNLQLKIAGTVLLVMGSCIVGHCAYVLFIKPRQFIPSPTTTPENFIVDGLYRFVRNPMYLGDFIIILSIFCLLGHLLLAAYFLVAIIFVNFMVIFKEEKELEKSFGKYYSKYKEQVPRWIPNFGNKG